MPQFVDRRLNPKQKSLGNRQRFMKRARAQIKEAVDRSIKERSVSDIGKGGSISIPSKGIDEPRFRHARSGGNRERVLPGNKEFHVGDKIKKPQSGAGQGGKKASDSGEGEDEFQFVLTRDEFLDIFFEDLELPDLVKKDLKEVQSHKPKRAGFSAIGTPTNLNVVQTMRASFGRRLALKRPSAGAEEELLRQIFEIESNDNASPQEKQWLISLHRELETLTKKRKSIPYVDPLDIRYNRFEPQPQPVTQAVMFCLMDVSGSMGEREKELAKRFFMLLHLFLKRRYERIEVVFIRHTHEAAEVDEETFFYSRETGGTVVSTALTEMMRVLKDRYSPADWNIYAAQASDGDNFSGDSERCLSILNELIMPLCQYYAYVEILDEREKELFHNPQSGTALWQSYRSIGNDWPNFEMKRIASPADIYPVFRELFSRDHAKA